MRKAQSLEEALAIVGENPPGVVEIGGRTAWTPEEVRRIWRLSDRESSTALVDAGGIVFNDMWLGENGPEFFIPAPQVPIVNRFTTTLPTPLVGRDLEDEDDGKGVEVAEVPAVTVDIPKAEELAPKTEAPKVAESEKADVSKLPYDELVALAKSLGMKTHNVKKADLLKLLTEKLG